MRDLSSYAFSPLRGGDLMLYRGFGEGLPPILLAAAEDSSLACLQRLEHEYALRAELDGAWAAAPIELSSHREARGPQAPGLAGGYFARERATL